MNEKSKFHQFISLVVSLGLLLQLILPLGAVAAQPVTQAPIPTTVVELVETTVSTSSTNAVSATNQPAALSPLTLSKAQSTFQAGATAVITYTLRNTLPPTLRPDADASDTITDTIAAINATDFAADPNNIRDTQLTLQLTNGQTALQSASLPADQAGDAFSFSLGDIPPLSAAELVLELTIPASAADFVELDAGVVGNGRFRSIPVSASISPIRLAPDGFAQWLTCTPDANCADAYVIRKAAELGHDPTAIFEFVRGLGYESYEGSLRGSRGTLWSEAGNGFDQASLLIALLRASGIPAAYRLGALDQTDAQTLLNSMFPAVNAPSGLVSAGTATADPANDSTLIAEVQNHAWAEAYFPGGGWTTLDPAFASAQPGDQFGSASGGQLVELPDATRHKVTVSLEVEKYSQFPVGGSNLYRVNPLTASFSAVALAGEPLVFAHLVDSAYQGGMAFTTAEHTYTPYFVFGEAQTLIEGDPFGELISNFPFGQDLVVAEWLDFTVTSPGGSSETFRRELFDDIGYEVRAGNGLISDMARDETARLSLMSSWTTLFAAYDVPEEAINDIYQEMVAQTEAGIATREATAGLQDTPNPTPEQNELAKEAIITYGNIARLAQRMHLLKFAAASDQSHDYIGDAFLVKAYPDSPRLFTVGWERNDQEETESISFDLLHNKIRAIAYPGQTDIGTEAFLFWRGLLDMAIEHQILQEVAPEPIISVGAVFNQAIADDIALERITFGTLDELAALPISEQAKARITTVLTENTNSYVLVPAQMVTLPGAPEATIGWLEINNETLELIDTMENGQHMAVAYAGLAKFSQKAGSFIGGFTAGFFSYTMGFWIGFFGQMPLGDQDIETVIAASKQTAAEWGEKAEDACIKKSDKKWCKRGVAAGNAIGSAVLMQADPPLQEMLFVLPLDAPVVTEETAVSLSQTASLTGKAVQTNVTTNLVGLTGPAAHAWTTAAQNSFIFDSLSVGSADVYQNGTLVASGAVTAASTSSATPTSSATSPTPASAQTDNSAITISGSADGTLSFYAPALPDLGGGSQLHSYNLSLNAANYTLALTNATVSVNGSSYSGDNLEIRSSSPSQLSGSGATAVPNFATSAAFTPNGGGFMVADAVGSLTVGGSPVSAANGFALANVNSQGSIAPAGATDTFSYSGNADFFALDLSSDSSTIPADSAASFDADIAANFTGSYTLTAHVPSGWDVSANSSGLITAQPPVGAAAGEYSILVTAQSQTYPDLFVSAEHGVTLTAVSGVSVSVAPDPTFTVPWGPAYEVVNFDTAGGRLQIPNAAFAATIQNTSSIAHTFDVDVSGLPFGWTILGGEAGSDQLSLPLAAGETVQLALYISPTTSLPPSGNSYPFNITATAADDGAITAVDNETFTMPAVAYPAVTVNPTTLYAAENSEATFDVTLTNIGNTSGSFDLASTVPVNDWSVSNLQSSIFLSPGAAATHPVTVTITNGEPGVDYPVGIGAAAPTLPYTPTTAVTIYLVSALTEPIYQAASCTLDSVALEAAIISLAGAVGRLEESCSSGDCDMGQRDDVVAAIRSVSSYAQGASSLVASHTALNTLADTLAGHSDDVDIEADLAALTPAMTDLGDELCQIEQYAPAARFNPYMAAILLGDTANLNLDVSNEGALASTYAITVTGLPGGDLTFNELIQPGATTTLPLTPTPATLAVFDLTATVVPDEAPGLAATAVSRLHVVDKFVQVTAVLPDPAFVETGTSSSTISAEIANVSGVVQAANVRTAVFDPGGSQIWTTDAPLNVLVGNPRLYELGAVDTSGWAAGVYTVTVELLDDSDTLIPEGSGYGYLSVGQALGASHTVAPTLTPPGTVTVTTVITTEILAGPLVLSNEAAPLPWPATGLVDSEQFTVDGEQFTVDGEPLAVDDEAGAEVEEQMLPTNLASPNTITGTVILRYEQDEAALSGTWGSFNESRASNGSYLRADAAGETAVFNFTGTWVNLGFIGDRYSGQAEIFIDGVSQGVLDLYRRDITAVSFVYDGLSAGAHTLTVAALNSATPQASNDYVQLDYLDVYNGGSYADGSFEETDSRLFLSTGWSNIADANASGGSYRRGSAATAWFPFTGDSVTYQALAYNAGGKVDLSIDGVYKTTFDLYNPLVSITRTLSFDGLGAGPHLLQVSSYRGNATVDAFATPGTAPFYTPPTPGSFTRYEEENPAFLYNGLPYTRTSQSWTRSDHIYKSEASGGQLLYSRTANDTASLTFDGVWASVGFFTDADSGRAEIFLDGVSQGVVDLYSNEEDVVSFTYDGLIAGSHTLSVTVLGTSNPLAGSQYVNLDYVDAWDGSALPLGRFEQTDAAVYRSGGWQDVAAANASGGSYSEAVLHGEPSVWFPFTGDSVTYQAWDFAYADEVGITIDDVFLGYYDIRTGIAPTITYSFDNLGAGLHMLKVRDYRSEPTLDAFITPAISASTPPPAAQVFTRHEEDDPAIRYNGLPYSQTSASWDRAFNVARASDGQYIVSSIAGNSISFDFNGVWVVAGFATSNRGGQAEIFIDGISQGVVDLYSRDDDTASFIYSGLPDTTHTISATLLSSNHPNASGTQMMVDYFDTWDGSALPAGTYEEDNPLVYRGDRYDAWSVFSEPAASDGRYIRDAFQHESAVWFPFTGDSFTILALANNSGDHAEIVIDGISQGQFNLYNTTPISRPISFDGLGSGPHVAQMIHRRGYLSADAFVTPGMAPFYQPPANTGVVRYEESHPDLRYNTLYEWRTRPQSWYKETVGSTSGGWHTSSAHAGDAVSLTFNGRWAAVGFRVRHRAGQAELFLDGVSQGIINVDNIPGEDVRFYPFGDLITGTHTISVSVVSGQVYFDYFDVWDGQPMSDDLVNARRGEDNGRLHYTANLQDVNHPHAIDGDMVVPGLWYVDSNTWYSFVGNSFDLLGVTRNNISNGDLFIDGVLVGTADFAYPYSEQPFSFHYSGLADGPHVVRINNNASLRVDAFQSNPAQPTPYLPVAEWWDNAPRGGSGAFGTPAGMLMGIAAGDLDGDGEIEIVAPSDTYTENGGAFMNAIFIYRGDGEDAGNGSPLIRRIDFPAQGDQLGREHIGSVALADLDGQPGSEIIIGSERGMYAFFNTGVTYWFTDTFHGPHNATVVTPAVGNLDLDAAPEIVVNMSNNLVVYTAAGDIAWSATLPAEVGMPLLADMTGDGLLDIVAYDANGGVRLYDYNLGAPQLLWQTTLSSAIGTVRGGPAIVDVDGDGSPEIAISHDGYHTALDAAGNVVWSTQLDPGAPGGVSVADIDGDGEIEIVTGMRYDDGIGIGKLYALNADGSILWQRPAYDDTSANSQSVLDLNGDGVYEIAWNGAQYGFTIFNGADGEILFNEPLAESLTGTDYPIFADVDVDGYAEIVAPTNGGIAVFGQDGAWGESRTVWNQHSYHITNVNIDLTIPAVEADSWTVHNTYRTQWPQDIVVPVYDVTVTHTVGLADVAVLTDTFSSPPTVSHDPVYGWHYTQLGTQPVITRTFDSMLTNLEPGETQLVAQETAVSYIFPSGANQITLPPLYVTAAHLGELTPLEQSIPAGGTAVFSLTLTNPASSADTFALAVSGAPSAWLSYPASVPLNAGETVIAPITVAVPDGTEADVRPLFVDVSNSGGGSDSLQATLTVFDGLDLTIAPTRQTALPDAPTAYTLTLTNLEAASRTYSFTGSGLVDLELPGSLVVAGGGVETAVFTATANAATANAATATSPDQLPFTIKATAASGGSASADAVLEILAVAQADLMLTPDPAVAGPLSTAALTLTVTNLSSLAETFDLQVSVPAGWSYELVDNSGSVSSVSLPPTVFNSAELMLRVTPDAAAVVGDYEVMVTAVAQSSGATAGSVTGTVAVVAQGVHVAFTSGPASLDPRDPATWNVQVTNTGNAADSFDLETGGIMALAGSVSPNTVTLAAGASQTVQLSVDGLDSVLPQTYLVNVAATSQTDTRIADDDTTSVDVTAFEAVQVAWQPAAQTVTNTLTAQFTLLITNTGNVSTVYDVETAVPGAATTLPTDQLLVPAHSAMQVVVTVKAPDAGVYTLTGTANSTSSSASDSAPATLTIVITNHAPVVDAGEGQVAAEGTAVLFNGSASDPDGDDFDLLWRFGDGGAAAGSLTPSHTFDDNGVYNVTLTVTDTGGLVGADNVLITVHNVAPEVEAGVNLTGNPNEAIQFDGSFTDPGTLDTHTIAWDFGDGQSAVGSLTPSHAYAASGQYTVTLTVTDDDGGSASDTLVVQVQYRLMLPVIMKP